MTMQAAPQASVEATAVRPAGCVASDIPNINPDTRLSTDYLNHFTEAIMVLEMVSAMPECQNDLRSWRPKTYVEHFATSRFTQRDKVIAAYQAADPKVRRALDSTADALNRALAEICDLVLAKQIRPAGALPQRQDGLKPLMARLAAIINGTGTGTANGAGSQAAVDALFAR